MKENALFSILYSATAGSHCWKEVEVLQAT